jgi:hypothetical protein
LGQRLKIVQDEHGVHRHRRVFAAVAPDAQRDLLGHRAGGEKERGFLAKHRRYLGLKRGQVRAGAILVHCLVALQRVGQGLKDGFH